jgi:large subunit ribosomal protein L9
MKVLLCHDVEKLGYLGDIVDVKNGYARNYLLPYGIATVPSDANVRALSDEKVKRTKQRQTELEKLATIAEGVNGAEAVIAAKANEQGHLFGSVSEREIGENLRQQGYEVTDRMIKLGDHIKEVGTHEATIKLAAELTATISVVVVSEDAAATLAENDSAEEEGQVEPTEQPGQ